MFTLFKLYNTAILSAVNLTAETAWQRLPKTCFTLSFYRKLSVLRHANIKINITWIIQL